VNVLSLSIVNIEANILIIEFGEKNKNYALVKSFISFFHFEKYLINLFFQICITCFKIKI